MAASGDLPPFEPRSREALTLRAAAISRKLDLLGQETRYLRLHGLWLLIGSVVPFLYSCYDFVIIYNRGSGGGPPLELLLPGGVMLCSLVGIATGQAQVEDARIRIREIDDETKRLVSDLETVDLALAQLLKRSP